MLIAGSPVLSAPTLDSYDPLMQPHLGRPTAELCSETQHMRTTWQRPTGQAKVLISRARTDPAAATCLVEALANPALADLHATMITAVADAGWLRGNLETIALIGRVAASASSAAVRKAAVLALWELVTPGLDPGPRLEAVYVVRSIAGSDTDEGVQETATSVYRRFLNDGYADEAQGVPTTSHWEQVRALVIKEALRRGAEIEAQKRARRNKILAAVGLAALLVVGVVVVRRRG